MERLHRNTYLLHQVILVLTLAAAAVAAPSGPPYGFSPSYRPAPSYASGPARYSFDYAVNDPPSGNDFGHQESRDGDHTQGSYYVQLPDGRLQQVAYTVSGDSGYLAEVTYQGEARYPTYQPAYRPAPTFTPLQAYKPIPVYG
ncbi:cuticle protein 7-like [Cherax quadricarinatus]|uniref:cuticle protein 7-like n=2 Tax=Cherax quadricarinatus TaxID=27406 RepID=UPI00387EA209